jgi:Fe-S cluster assembly ATP-binding protein
MNIRQKEILRLEDLTVSCGGKRLLEKVKMTIYAGERVAVVGRNGSGKTTLLNSIAGNPKLKIDSGKIIFQDKDISRLQAYERALEGIFMTMQYPTEISGITFKKLLSELKRLLEKSPEKNDEVKFWEKVEFARKLLNLENNFLTREINVGFSGGEKKKTELLFAYLLSPKVLLLDEIDSGLDEKSKDAACKLIDYISSERKEFSLIVVTHSNDFAMRLGVDRTITVASGRIDATKNEKQRFPERSQL